MDLCVPRLHRWHLHKRPLSCFRHVPSGSDVTVQLQNRCCLCCSDTNRWKVTCRLHGVNRVVVDFVLHRSEPWHGEGLDRAGGHGVHREDCEQSKVLHWVSFNLPWRYYVPSKTHCYKASCNTAADAHSHVSLQRRDAPVRTTRRAAMFPGFWNSAGPSNNCRRSEAQCVLGNTRKIQFVFKVRTSNLGFVHVCHSSSQSCLTWSTFRTSTCCCLSSHVTGLSHTVGQVSSATHMFVSVFDSLCVSWQDYTKTTELISMTFCGGAGHDPRDLSPQNVVFDLEQGAVPGTFLFFICI